MFVKYFVKTQERPLGLKYNAMTLTMVLGGHESLLTDITAVAKDFFGVDLTQSVEHTKRAKKGATTRTVMSTNKIRFQCTVAYDVFQTGLQKLRDAGVPIIPTKELGRIMR